VQRDRGGGLGQDLEDEQLAARRPDDMRAGERLRDLLGEVDVGRDVAAAVGARDVVPVLVALVRLDVGGRLDVVRREQRGVGAGRERAQRQLRAGQQPRPRRGRRHRDREAHGTVEAHGRRAAVLLYGRDAERLQQRADQRDRVAGPQAVAHALEPDGARGGADHDGPQRVERHQLVERRVDDEVVARLVVLRLDVAERHAGQRQAGRDGAAHALLRDEHDEAARGEAGIGLVGEPVGVPDQAARRLRGADERLAGVVALVHGEHVADERRQLHERARDVGLLVALGARPAERGDRELLLELEQVGVGERQVVELLEVAGLLAAGRRAAVGCGRAAHSSSSGSASRLLGASPSAVVRRYSRPAAVCDTVTSTGSPAGSST
jgi:hypothetical protein